ncbi:PH domain-containing protein [Aquimonas sp.]|jgi:membrane protein YdbS with pleckstrin-like domain|uniref:PH domain-containing protein n=1 Tax=Aquimonas sp. TaxID=1872588 RepID=UPI0037BED513
MQPELDAPPPVAAPPELPPNDFDALQPLHLNARWGMRLGAALLALPPLLPVLLIAQSRLPMSQALMVTAALALLLQLLAWWYSRARFSRTRFALDADGLLIQRGVFWCSETRVPRSRVQHTDINRGPIDRWLGLAELKVHTAGTRLAAVALPGLGEDQARRLRNALLGEDDDAV